MKKKICVFLSLILFSMAVISCGSRSSGTDETKEGSSQRVDDNTSSRNDEEKKELDMEAFLTGLSKDHPEASADELIDLMLKDPYFLMFTKVETDSYYPGLNYEYVPKGLKKAACIADYITGSNAIVYVLETEEGTAPEDLAEAFSGNLDPYYTQDLKMEVLSISENGKGFVALYKKGMMPVEGPIAGKPRDLCQFFLDYRKDHPEASPLEICDYLKAHQKYGEMYTQDVAEGVLTGFGDFEHEVEIKGFKEGAVLSPVMSPSLFLCYVFKLETKEETEAFEKTLKDNANLAWNVCMVADTVITQADDQYVLFMMCSENTGE